jgi:hypothetical protein
MDTCPGLGQCGGMIWKVHGGFGAGIMGASSQGMITKQSFYLAAVTLMFAGILAKMRAMMDKHVPVGYQDENGFHLGTGSEKGSKNWPPFA